MPTLLSLPERLVPKTKRIIFLWVENLSDLIRNQKVCFCADDQGSNRSFREDQATAENHPEGFGEI